MKTPMQEHIKWLEKEHKKLVDMGELGVALNIGDCIEHAESMLEMEKHLMGLLLNFVLKHYDTTTDDLSKTFYFVNAKRHEVFISEILEHFYNETFNTK